MFTSKILIIFEEHFSKIRCIKGHFSFGRNTNGRCPFFVVRLAKRAEANYPIRKTAIVDLNILDDFLEDNPEVVSELKKRKGKRYGK